MKQLKDCNGVPRPSFGVGTVNECSIVETARPLGSIYLLTVDFSGLDKDEPLAGQFYMLRSVKSEILLGRPISVYAAEKNSDGTKISFLILKKGTGTQELCSLKKGDEIELIGPEGNTFPLPDSKDKICIVGGGVGVAPVAGFASTLADGSYDFYASFKSGSYGLDYVKPESLTVTTDDGSVGVHGMITAALTEDVIRQKGYSVVYACGPTPMLAYIQKICLDSGVKCYLSMENRMACGVGACLGCTISTKEGNKRCCKDGPVFDGAILDFTRPSTSARKPPLEQNEIPDLSTTIAGVRFENPVIAASGTFGYGAEYADIFDVNALGGICSKGLTLDGRPGNGGVRLVETKGGLINSIGLENPGIKHFVEHELPSMLALKPVTIANLSGSSLETYVEGAKLLDATDVPMIELNISCPNVKAGGMAFGMDCASAASVTAAVRAVTKKPLMVKLSPNAPDLIGIAMAVTKAKADAISLVNTFQAMSIDVESGKPVFNNVRAGFSGPAVKPIALRMVYDVVQAMNRLPENERIPVVGLGGISSWRDAVEFIMAGASAIEVGTATFGNPLVMKEIIGGLSSYMKRKGFKSLEDFRGSAQKL